jgi:hypothetical protein
MNNPLIQEVRAARESLAAKFDFDLHRIIADAIQRQGNSDTVELQNCPNKLPETKGLLSKSPMTGKRRVRSARVSS